MSTPSRSLKDRVIIALAKSGIVGTDIFWTQKIADLCTPALRAADRSRAAHILEEHLHQITTAETQHFVPAAVAAVLEELHRAPEVPATPEMVYGLVFAPTATLGEDGSFKDLHREGFTRAQAIAWMQEWIETGGNEHAFIIVETPAPVWRASHITAAELLSIAAE